MSERLRAAISVAILEIDEVESIVPEAEKLTYKYWLFMNLDELTYLDEIDFYGTYYTYKLALEEGWISYNKEAVE